MKAKPCDTYKRKRTGHTPKNRGCRRVCSHGKRGVSSGGETVKGAQSRLILCNPRDCSPPDSSIHGILQARVLDWGAIAYRILKSRDITLSTKVCLVKAMVFPVDMYGCESWTEKKAEHQRIDACELWCWRRLLRVPWTARRSNQSILKISPGRSLEGLMLKLKL